VTQYSLALVSSQENATGAGWYDSGSVATFSLPTNRYQLFWIFQGWYEDGHPITTSSTGSIVMDSANTITAQWGLDYVLLGTVIAVIAVVTVLGLLYHKKRLPPTRRRRTIQASRLISNA